MLLVRAYIGVDYDEPEDLDGVEVFTHKLFVVCCQVVPSGFNSKMGRLTPGSIQYIPQETARQGLTVDVLLEIEAFSYEDRQNLDERARAIKAALKELFPDKTFAIWPKLVNAGWASDSTDPEFDGDMLMSQAVWRARQALATIDS